MSEPTKPSVPGWRFAVNEVSMGVYKATGVHDDGRSVERANSDLNALYRDMPMTRVAFRSADVLRRARSL